MPIHDAFLLFAMGILNLLVALALAAAQTRSRAADARSGDIETTSPQLQPFA